MAMMGVFMMGVLLGLVYIYLIARIISFLFEARGLHIMAKNRNKKNAWLAYIPLVQNYTLGKVVGSIRIFKCEMHRPALYLLILSVLPFIFKAPVLENPIFTWLGTLFILIFAILKFIVYYHLFSYYLNDSRKVKLFTVLSVVFVYFSVASYFIFAIRNNSYCYEEENEI